MISFDHDETLAEARQRNIHDALFEDIGRRDWTGELVPAGRRVRATVICRDRALLCGREWFDGVVLALDPAAAIDWQIAEGGWMAPGAPVVHIDGDARALLAAERPALNFIQLLSATATQTRRHVDAVAGASPLPEGCAILDTRKTVPGLRSAQKYAVRAGGGVNHRMGLFDAILIKENHIAAAGSISAAVRALRASHPALRIEVEVENMQELDEALAAGVEMIMLDNFTLDAMRAATAHVAGRALVEISGGVELDALAALGTVGADFISVGALTKNVRAIDFSMRIES